DIKPMASASESILALKPVTFRYNDSVDACATPQFGLIAEEVAKINPDLVVRDREGKIFTVRYEAVNAMLLNEFLKEHHKVENLETTIARQEDQIAKLGTLLEKAASRIQKVETQVELQGSTTQVADGRP
ncbi:MAG: tail fiber domain-containing protein, partial [Chthoniobacterales bacterium]